MSTHQLSIGVRLRQLQQRSGLTMQQLATLMGYKNASSIQRYLTNEYGEVGFLPVGVAAKFSDAITGRGEPPIASEEIFAMAGLEITGRGTMRPTAAIAGVADAARPWGEPLPQLEALLHRQNVADLPIYGTALGSDIDFVATGGATVAVQQATLDMTDAIDFVRRPAALERRRDAYAVIVAGDSMYPRFQDGEIAVVDPRRPPAPGQDVIVQLADDNGHDGTDRVVCVLIKRLVRRSASWVELEQFNPPATFRLDMSAVKAIHRIVTMGELLGS
jgi:phage repressor protein C with HTH and peptisase S24 domain